MAHEAAEAGEPFPETSVLGPAVARAGCELAEAEIVTDAAVAVGLDPDDIIAPVRVGREILDFPQAGGVPPDPGEHFPVLGDSELEQLVFDPEQPVLFPADHFGVDRDVLAHYTRFEPIRKRNSTLNWRVPHATTPEDRAYLDSAFPGVKFHYKEEHLAWKRHGHIRAHISREVHERQLTERILATEPNGLVLDVGGSPRLRLHPNKKYFHSCESGMNSHVLFKVQEWQRKYQCLRDRLPDGTLAPLPVGCERKGWTYCRCSASQCRCNGYVLAMFVHSIYYNSPEEVALILYNTARREGYSIHHHFRKNRGQMYDGETSYVVQGDLVTQRTRENSIPYHHSAARWLLANSCDRVVHICVRGQTEPKTFTLVWVTWNQDRWTDLTHFKLMEGDVSSSVRPDIESLCTRQSNFAYVTDLSSEESEMVKACAPEAVSVYSTDYGLYIGMPRKGITVPRYILAQLARKFAVRTVNEDLAAEIAAEARRLCNAKSPDNKGWDASSLAAAIPFLVAYTVQTVVHNDTSVFNQFFTHSMREEIEHHNRLLEWGTWRWDWPAVNILLRRFSFGLLSLVLFPFIVAWLLALYVESRGVQVGEGLLELLHRFFQAYFAHPSRYGTVILIYVLIVLFMLRTVRAAEIGNEFDVAWRDFAHTYNTEHRCLPRSVRCNRLVATLDGYESQYDIQDIEPHPSYAYKMRGETPCRADPREAVVVAGVSFTAGMPMVCARSTKNMEIAVITRGLGLNLAVDDSAWDSLEALMAGELPLISDGGWVRADIDRVAGIDPHNYPIVKHDEYLARYPPAKRKDMLKAYDRYMNNGGWYGGLFYSAFMKMEKMCYAKLGEFEEYRPRLIQGLSSLAKILLGPWFLNYSNAMKVAWNAESWIWYSSGATAEDHSAWFCRAVDELGGADGLVAIYSDYSKYDMTQSPRCIVGEHRSYIELGLLEHHELAGQILKGMYRSQVRTSRWARTFFKFAVDGTRKSGDLNTSSGNSRTTGMVIGSFLKARGLRDHSRIVVLGDDNLALVSRVAFDQAFTSFQDCIDQATEEATKLGFKLKVGVTSNLLEAEYVSARFYPVGNSYVFGKKPGRTMCKVGCFMAKAGRPDYNAYLKGTLQSLLPTSNHVPFLRVYVRELLDRLEGVDAVTVTDHYKVRGTEIHECDAETWTAFSALYGFGESEEKVFHNQLRSHIDRYGLASVMHSPVVNSLFTTDYQL